MADSRFAPDERWKAFATAGPSTIMPTNPNTTDGMPAKSSTTAVRKEQSFLGAR